MLTISLAQKFHFLHAIAEHIPGDAQQFSGVALLWLPPVFLRARMSKVRSVSRRDHDSFFATGTLRSVRLGSVAKWMLSVVTKRGFLDEGTRVRSRCAVRARCPAGDVPGYSGRIFGDAFDPAVT